MRLSRLFIAAGLVIGSLSARPALAQDAAHDPFGTRPIRLGFAGGVVVPRTGASVQTLRTGVQGQGFVLIQLPGLPALRANVDYARMKFEDPAVAGSAASADASRTILDGVLALKMDLIRTGPIRPYLLAGVGAYNIEDEVEGATTGTTSYRETNFGLDGGAGIGFRLGPISGFVETRLQNVYTKEKGFVDTKSIQQFPVSFGIVF